ncbi:MAG: hypothetical protein ACOYMB_04650 [Patescibacteria group bacterium]
MFKENFNNQEVAPETVPKIETAKPFESESEKILEQAQEAIEAIEEGVNLASNSKSESNSQKKSLLEFLRSGIARKFIQTAAALGLFVGSTKFAEAGNSALPSEKDKSELSQNKIKTINNPKPEDYDLSKMGELDLTDLNEKKNLEENDCQRIFQQAIKNEHIRTLEEKIKNNRKDYYNILKIIEQKKQELDSITDHNSSLYQDKCKSLENKQQMLVGLEESYQSKLILKNKASKNEFKVTEEEKSILANAQEFMTVMELARDNVRELLSGEVYLKHLMKEFACSREEAAKHQRVRISNVGLINYRLESLDEIKKSGNENPNAYFINNTNVVVLPYDLDRMEVFYLALHEMLHGAVNGDKGLSKESEEDISWSSFQENERFEDGYNAYMLMPAERYVRFKMLNYELNKLGVKRLNEKFTKEHYQKFMKILKDGQAENGMKIHYNAADFIRFTRDFADPDKGYERLKKIFDEVAVNEKENSNDQKDGTYQHPGWDYSGTEKSV